MPVAMKLAKCFFTEEMPEGVYLQIKHLLEGDYGHYNVATKFESYSIDHWFVGNGAVPGERVFLERGSSEEYPDIANSPEVTDREAN
jgi:hypothetical protein